MTTAASPAPVLRAQATRIAQQLKEISKRTPARENITFGIVMDDKIMKITIPWTVVRDCDEGELAEYIHMEMSEVSPN